MKKPPRPRYQQIKDALLEDIKHGNYTLGQPFVTQEGIRARFGVSRITADRAINDLVDEGILFRRRGHGTFLVDHTDPREFAAMHGGEHSIGCIMNYIHSGHSVALMQGIERRCREANCPVLLFNSEESVEIEADNLLRARRAGVAGLIVYPVDGFANSAHFARLRQEGIPLIMVDRYYPMIPTDAVVPDNLDVGYQVTLRLIQQGHERIGLVWSSIACTSVYERLIGYQRALRDAQLPIHPSLCALRRYYDLPESERLAFLQDWRASPDSPTAIIAVSWRVLARLKQDLPILQVRSGDEIEIALASMDTMDADTERPNGGGQLTLPSFTMGYEAATVLLNRLRAAQPAAPQHRIFSVEVSPHNDVIVPLHESAE